MKKYILNILSTFAVVIIGCATAYQPGGLTGGYKSIQLDENMFRVSFNGNAYTNLTRATDFTLLRCAEICKAEGFSYFQIIESEKGIKKTKAFMSQATETTQTSGIVNSSGRFSATSTTTKKDANIQERPKSSNTIICYYDKPTNGISYTAEFLIKSLKEQYKITG